MKYVVAITFIFLFTGCTHTVADYTSAIEDNTSPWIDLYGDTTKDMSVYITYSDGKVAASISGYSHPDSMNFLEDIDISISEYQEQQTELQFCFGPFPGTDKVCHSNNKYSVMAWEINLECDTTNCEQISFAATRGYSAAEKNLPDTLHLNYSVTTADGTKTGSYPFVKYEKEVTETIRIH